MQLDCLYEDHEIIVCLKPAGMPSQSDKTGDYDLLSCVKNHLAVQTLSRDEPYAALVHRLDRPVGGVMVFAKTQSAASHLSRQIAQGRFQKRYLAAVSSGEGKLCPGQKGVLKDYLAKDSRTNLSRVAEAGEKQAKRAELLYEVKQELVIEDKSWYLLEIGLLTGRHHQIRVQLSSHFGGIWGDTKYHPEFAGRKGWFSIALYSHYLGLEHPKTGEFLEFQHAPDFYPLNAFEEQGERV